MKASGLWFQWTRWVGLPPSLFLIHLLHPELCQMKEPFFLWTTTAASRVQQWLNSTSRDHVPFHYLTVEVAASDAARGGEQKHGSTRESASYRELPPHASSEVLHEELIL